jgi:hypothetical protein
MVIATTASVARVAHNGGVHAHKNMSLNNPPGETFSRTKQNGHKGIPSSPRGLPGAPPGLSYDHKIIRS